MLDLQSGGSGFESQPGLLCTKVYSAFYPSGVGKWVPAVAGKAKAGMAHSKCGWTCGCAGKTVKSLENTCHAWALLWWWFTTKRRYVKCMHLYLYICFWSLFLFKLGAVIMRPSSLGGGRILRRTLSVCLSVCLSVRPVIGCRTVLRANIQNRKTSVFAYGPASRMYFLARTEGRISYGHLGRTNSCFNILWCRIK